ncbi:MAG: trigger factor, partial [Erysipelotrichaceae bacterium]|nr:trigger factor [Erysipelotrichaceae bacterium]
VIDFEGFVDGKAFEGGKGEDFPLEIGSHSFVDNFEEQLIGLQTGDEKDVVVTFPQNYTAELAGKEATFKVKVNGIKEKQLPELNDELVETLKYDGVHTVDELNNYIKKNLKESKQRENEDKATNEMLDKLMEICEVEIPEAMIDQEVENSYREQESNLKQQGFNMDLYFKITGTDEATLKQQLRAGSEAKVKTRVLLDAVGNDMNVQVEEKDLEEQYKAMAEQYGMEADKIKELIPAEYLSEDIKMQKTLEELKKQI